VGIPYDSLNPFVGYYGSTYAALTMMYPNIVQYSQDLKVEPEFAQSWTTSDDGLTWTFTTRAGAAWSDGQPLTAKDAAWTIETVLRLQGGAAAILSPFVAGIKSATAVDDTTLEVKLAKPSPGLLSNLYQLPILPEHFWQKYAQGDGAKLKTVSMDPADGPVVVAGPFTIEKLDYKGTTIFKRVETFYGPKPLITGYGYQVFTNADAAVQALKSDAVDCVYFLPPTSADAVKSDPKLEVQGFGGAIPIFLAVNYSRNNITHSELSDPQVREALSVAMDRDAVVTSVYRGFAEPGGSLLLNQYVPQFVSAPVPVPARDVAKANQMLDGLGYAKGSDGIRVAGGHKMEYTILVSSSNKAVDGRTAELLKQNFAEIGIGLQQKIVDNPMAVILGGAKPYSDYDMYLSPFGLTPDPDFSLLVLTTQMLGSYNVYGYSNPAYDELWTQQTSEMDAAKRRAIIDQMSAMLAKDQVELPICYWQIVAAWNKKWQNVPDAGDVFGFYSYLRKTKFDTLAVQK